MLHSWASTAAHAINAASSSWNKYPQLITSIQSIVSNLHRKFKWIIQRLFLWLISNLQDYPELINLQTKFKLHCSGSSNNVTISYACKSNSFYKDTSISKRAAYFTQLDYGTSILLLCKSGSDIHTSLITKDLIHLFGIKKWTKSQKLAT